SASEASLCWVNALWEIDAAPESWAEIWLQTEGKGRDNRSAATEAADLDELLNNKDETNISVNDVRTLAAGVVWAASCETPPRVFVQRLDRIQRYFEKQDWRLSVRGCWLAWLSLTRLSHGDVLGLARARDRLLERLYRNGLSSDADMAGFLRFSGQK